MGYDKADYHFVVDTLLKELRTIRVYTERRYHSVEDIQDLLLVLVDDINNHIRSRNNEPSR